MSNNLPRLLELKLMSAGGMNLTPNEAQELYDIIDSRDRLLKECMNEFDREAAEISNDYFSRLSSKISQELLSNGYK